MRWRQQVLGAPLAPVVALSSGPMARQSSRRDPATVCILRGPRVVAGCVPPCVAQRVAILHGWLTRARCERRWSVRCEAAPGTSED
eukprot:6065810-Lingulodinium_polyedra.AAC.1